MIAHDVHTYLCARAVHMLDVPVTITPYTYHEMDTDRYNPSYAWEMREGKSPVTESEHPLKDEREYYSPFVTYDNPVGGRISSLKTLALYSAEPDWGMDDKLQLSPLQVVTDGSQGYRHLRYGWCLLRAGVAHRRALHFKKLAEHAYTRGDSYWGLRFSARTLHYIQDLLTPVHLKPIPEWYWLPRLFRLKKVFNTIYSQHMRFEGFVGYHLWHGSDSYVRIIENGNVHELPSLRHDLLLASRKVRRMFYGLFRESLLFWGDGASHPPAQLRSGWIQGHVAPEQLHFRIMGWLNILSGIIKGYIRMYVLPHMQRERR
jgi:hypothetical protein